VVGVTDVVGGAAVVGGGFAVVGVVWGTVVTCRTVVVVCRIVVVVWRTVVAVVAGGTVVGGVVVVVSTGPELTDRLTVDPFFTLCPAGGSVAYTTPVATVSLGMLTGLAFNPSLDRATTASSWVLFTRLGTGTVELPPPPPLERAMMIRMMTRATAPSPAQRTQGGRRRWS